MKQSLKKLMFFLLALSIVLACLPATAEAFQIVIGKPALRVTETVLIPGAMDPDQRIRTVEAKTAPLTIVPYGAGEYLKDPAAAAAQLREAMKKRQTTATILYEADASLSFQAVIDIIWDKTLDHTGVGAEGDYLMWQRGEMSAGGSYYPGGQTNQYTIDFTISYYTTAEQEAWMDTAVEDLLDSLELDGLSDYQTLCAIYDWMCANITYDYANLENEAYDLKYTAYAALHDKTSVCQGYAVLLYRLLLEEGIDCRVITGTGNGGPHAWNIVELEGKYYNLDSTWDATYSQAGMEYKCFVCCEATFEDHARSDEYTTDAFNTAYPMGEADYTPSEAVVIASGICGENLTWSLDDNGVLTVKGTGPMDDYNEYSAWSLWDHYQSVIYSVVIEDGVTSIGSYAFSGCNNLTGVSLPDGLVSIGSYAFSGCNNLTGVSLPDSLVSFGSSVFDYRYFALTQYENAEYLGNENNPYLVLVRASDTNITSCVIHEDTKVIAGSAFSSCGNLESITIPEGLVGIGHYAFFHCTHLQNVHITDVDAWCRINFVDQYANPLYNDADLLVNNELLTGTLVIPDDVTIIGCSLFQGCSGLTEIVIPDSVTSIGDQAFYGCSGLTEIVIPKGITSIGERVFSRCSKLISITVEAGNESYCSVDGILFSKDMKTLIRYPEANPAEYYYIPECVTSIAGQAFYGCTYLSGISVPPSITKVGGGAFADCPNLWSADITDLAAWCNIEFVGLEANPVSNLGNVGGLRMNGEYIRDIVIPEGVTIIRSYTLAYNSTVNSVTIPDSVTCIEDHAFYASLELKSVVFGNGVTSIGENAFYGCGKLYDIVIPDSVTCIEDNAFALCRSLTEITIPDSVTSIGNGAFSFCSGLKKVVLGSGITEIPTNMFAACYDLTCIAIPNGITTIESGAFSTCFSLTVVFIPASVTKIEGSAFFSCNLWHVLYSGTEEEWNNITIQLQEDVTWLSAQRHYNCTGNEMYKSVDAPTCEEKGYAIHTCTLCNESVKVIIDPELGHTPGAEATCTTAQTCTVCNAELVSAKGHSYNSAVTDPTCAEQGYTTHTCATCGHSYQDDYTQALGHTEISIPATAPTCVDTGLTEGKCCAVCNEILVAQTVIDALGHSYQTVVTPPSCGEQGYTTHTCTTCGDWYQDSYVDAKGHSYTSEVVAPTCTERGYTKHTCSACGYEYMDSYTDRVEHNMVSTVTEPTCISWGSITYTCSACGYSYAEHTEEPLEHNYVYEVTVEPTCETGGEWLYTCTQCGDVFTEIVGPTGHRNTHLENEKAVGCMEDGYSGDWVCDACGVTVEFGYVIEATGNHSYSVVITTPTCETPGGWTYTCDVCGYVYVEELPAYGHSTYIEGATDATCGVDGYTGDEVCTTCGKVIVYGYVISATGNHDYTSYVSVEPGCDTNGERVYSCNVCGDSYTEAISPTGHYSTHMEKVKEVTCLEDGYTGDQVCDICGQILSYGVVIPAAGQHSYMSIDITAPTCEAEGERKYECIVCSDTYYETIPATGHGFITVNVVSPTCGTDGYSGDTQCISCGYVLQYGVIMPATGEHNCTSEVVIEPTCDSSGWRNYHCVDCGYGYTEEIPAIGHTYTTTIVQPTCSAQGYTEYSCVTCGYSYAADYTDMIDHTYSTETVPPTCTETGYILYTCQNCGYNYREELAATGHQSTSICNRREPTCGADGYTGDTVCDACQMVLASGTAIPATGDHNYGDWSIFYEPTEYSPGLEIRYCQTCGVSDTREIPILEHVHDYSYQVTTYYPTCTQAGYTLYECRCGDSYRADEVEALGHTEVIDRGCPATCTSDGITDGSHCSVCYEVLVYQTVIPATGHSYQETEVAPTCTEPGYWMRTCTSCGDSTTEAIAPTGHMNTYIENAKDATCGGEGYTGDTVCCDCGAIVEYGTVIPASGLHSYNSEVTAPGCETTGLETFTCVNCGYSYQEELPATGHRNTNLYYARKATCTADGYTGDVICDDCKAVVEYGVVIPATGHSYEMVLTEPTCTEDGSKYYSCHCGDAYTEVIPAIGHNYADVVTEPTCTEGGYTTHTCANCGASFTSDHIEPLDHSWDAGVVTKEPTEEEAGEKIYTCTRCGETRVEIIGKKQPVIYDIPEDNTVTIPDNDCFEGGTTVTVDVMDEGITFETVTEVMESVAQKYVAYEFTATKDDAAVQPNGKLTVTFRIPEDYSNNIAVYYMDESGKLTKLESVVDVQSRTVTAELEHFSTYILADLDSAPQVLSGDVNGDGRVNARDARALLRYLAGLDDASMIDMAAADFNGDGRINARDARAILQKIAGIG